MKVRGSQVGRGFWLQWVVASTVGMLVGMVIGFFLGVIILNLLELLDPLTDIALGPYDPLNEVGGLLGFGIGLGIGVGLLQWLVLRRRVSGVGWWVLASAAGSYGIIQAGFNGYNEIVWMSVDSPFGWAGVVALSGAVVGTLQWFVLRGQVSRAGWWVLASTLGWGLGMAAAIALSWGVGANDFVAVALTGAVLGAVTGGVLVWLLRQPVPEA